MATAIKCPQVGQDLTEATLVEWKIREGDQVSKGDVVAEVESDKAVFEVESFASGKVTKLLFKEGEEVTVLEPIAYIGDVEDESDIEEGSDDSTERDEVSDIVKENETKTRKEVNVEDRLFASPSARRIAREYEIDISKVEGTGPRGRVIKRDIIAYKKSEQTAHQESLDTKSEVSGKIDMETQIKEEDAEIPFSKMRKAIANRLVESKQKIPHFYLFSDIDMTVIVAWRKAYNDSHNANITFNDIILKVVGKTLNDYNQLNAHVINEKIVLKNDINLGIAVSVEDGLLVPIIYNTNKKTIQEIHEESKTCINKAKSGQLRPGNPATFTVSNLGMYAVNQFIPIINPPECAILGIGSIEKRVVPFENNTFGIRQMMSVSLACDHRAVDGAYAAKFLSELKHNLEKFGSN